MIKDKYTFGFNDYINFRYQSMNFLKTFIIIVSSCVLFTNCKTEPNSTPSADTVYERISGKTMGTTYNITYQGSHKNTYQAQIDSLLKAINQEVSTYIPEADISLFNKKTATTFTFSPIENPHFAVNLSKSQMVYEQTNGHFDPTVMPLVNYWGFGYTEKKAVTNVDSIKIKTILESVGFDRITVDNSDKNQVILTKPNANTQLDFSAIAKGYAVDVIGAFLTSKGVVNYFVEIGGETVCHGKSPRGGLWTLGISRPSKEAAVTDVEQIVHISNKGLATSGNYRNYHTADDGKIYAHTINPKNGFPEKSNLLSATVVAEDCMTADALATACMVMGKNKAIALAEKLPNVEIFLIFGDEHGELETFSTEGFKVFLTDNQ